MRQDWILPGGVSDMPEVMPTLHEAVHTAEAQTVAAYDQAIRAGLVPDQARELVREEWAFLSDEDDVRRFSPAEVGDAG